MRQSLRGLVDHLTQIGIPSQPRRARDAVHDLARARPARRAPAGGGVARDREARGARGEVRRDAVQARGRLVVGLGDVQRERRRPIPTRPPPRASGSGRATRRSATARRAAGAGLRQPRSPRASSTCRRATRCLTSAGSDLAQGGRALHRAHRRPGLRGERPARGADALGAAEGRLPRRALGRAGRDRRRASAATAASTGRRSRAAQVTLADARAIIAARLERDDVEDALPGAARRPQRRSTTSSRPTRASRCGSSRRRSRRRGSAAPRAAGRSRRSRRARSSRSPGPGRSTRPTGRSTSPRSATAMPLGLLPHAEGARGRAQALGRLDARGDLPRAGCATQEKTLLGTASCLNDQVPAVGGDRPLAVRAVPVPGRIAGSVASKEPD